MPNLVMNKKTINVIELSCLWTIVLLLTTNLLTYGQNCNLPQAKLMLNKIEQLNGANKTIQSIEVADSLLKVLSLSLIHI